MKSSNKLLLTAILLLLGFYACSPLSTRPTPPTISIPVTIISLSTEPAPQSTTTPWQWLPYNPSPSDKGCGPFTATIPIKGTGSLLPGEIAQELFEVYLEHYQAPELGGMCRLEEFTIETTQRDERLGFLAGEQAVDFVASIGFSVRVKEAPSGWAAGNGDLVPGGWIVHKSLIIGVSKFGKQYVLKLIGTGP